jgi:hypothetical protein
MGDRSLRRCRATSLSLLLPPITWGLVAFSNTIIRKDFRRLFRWLYSLVRKDEITMNLENQEVIIKKLNIYCSTTSIGFELVELCAGILWWGGGMNQSRLQTSLVTK